jgi:3-oxoacyl-[acyl-carrier-protein] synthase-3
MSFDIIGTGSAAPAFLADNADMERLVDTSDEWITTRTGIKTRHIIQNETLLILLSVPRSLRLKTRRPL